MTTCQTCRAQGFEPRKSGCSFCSGEYGGGRPTPRPVPVQIVHGARLGGTATMKLDRKIKIPSLDEVWRFAPRHDEEHPAPGQWFDLGPATRTGY
jgi:hypothetical protein